MTTTNLILCIHVFVFRRSFFLGVCQCLFVRIFAGNVGQTAERFSTLREQLAELKTEADSKKDKLSHKEMTGRDPARATLHLCWPGMET